MLGQVATKVMSNVTYERLGPELILRCEIKDNTPKA
jgi:hypothetical protein